MMNLVEEGPPQDGEDYKATQELQSAALLVGPRKQGPNTVEVKHSC